MYTRLGADGYGVRRTGSFAGKTPSAGAHPVGILTRLSLDGYGARRAGSFAGKTGTSHPVGILTRLSLDGYGVRRYGSFAGKTPGQVIPPVEPVPTEDTASRQPRRFRIHPRRRDEEDILALTLTILKLVS